VREALLSVDISGFRSEAARMVAEDEPVTATRKALLQGIVPVVRGFQFRFAIRSPKQPEVTLPVQDDIIKSEQAAVQLGVKFDWVATLDRQNKKLTCHLIECGCSVPICSRRQAGEKVKPVKGSVSEGSGIQSLQTMTTRLEEICDRCLARAPAEVRVEVEDAFV